MAKARRRLSDLVHEETQKIREPNLQSSEVTKPESLLENLSEAEERGTEQQTPNLTDLQTLVITKPVSQPESSNRTDSTTEEVTEQQTPNLTDLQTSEVPNSVSSLKTPSEVEERGIEQQTPNLTDLQTSVITKPVSQPESSNRTDSTTEEVTGQQTPTLTDLQTSEVPNSVSSLKTPNEVEERGTEQQTPNFTDLQTNKDSESVSSTEIAIEQKSEEVNKTTELQSLKDTDLQSTELPKYLKLERKETRLRQDQIDALTDLTRKLNRTKRVKGGERLTDNTLIRVAVDLLLSKASELQGTTEDELRSSLNL
ncbi:MULTISPECIES: hypothetical protein [Nostoc]|uniref:Uncharacterized protein n=1 Tax=Nostoc paludosum FACHB-159 TaxID=2692908 RepID=A0ABR8KGJ5_9NOSO|nr:MULTISPECIES: hypothetical protein [Nostoc]MBD2680939.1 hypothetical protein [Nostoc sp. FACHB-857]MBD2737415.1 hypothetical protein [Nostoc paludosum FACHB-159]